MNKADIFFATCEQWKRLFPPVLCVQGWELVAVLRGANAPLLQKMIVEELAKEKKVLELDIKRIAVSSTILQAWMNTWCPIFLLVNFL